jgi:hypothetical protein
MLVTQMRRAQPVVTLRETAVQFPLSVPILITYFTLLCCFFHMLSFLKIIMLLLALCNIGHAQCQTNGSHVNV